MYTIGIFIVYANNGKVKIIMLQYTHRYGTEKENSERMEILDKERLKECRLQLGITKQEAAKRIQISQPAYLRYEDGSRNPSIQTISKMAEIFSTSVDYLTGKSSVSKPDRIIIEQSTDPELFLLAEVSQKLNGSQIERLVAYAKELLRPQK